MHVLHPEQSGVVVVMANLHQFIGRPVVELNTFVKYETGSQGKRFTLQLAATPVRVRASEVFSDKLWVKFTRSSGELRVNPTLKILNLILIFPP